VAAPAAAATTADVTLDNAFSGSPLAAGAASNPVAATAPLTNDGAAPKDGDAIPKTRPSPRRATPAAAQPPAAAARPAQTDTPVPVPTARNPSEQCRGRLALAWYRCVKRACDASPAFADTHECQRVQQIEADNRRQRDR